MNMKKLDRLEVWEMNAKELGLYADKNQDLYKARLLPIEKNLDRKLKKGIFDFEDSVKLWRWWADGANMRHEAQFKFSFSTKVRQQVAVDKANAWIIKQLKSYADELSRLESINENELK